MKKTSTSIVINDYDNDLLELLKSDYEERIAKVKSVAKAKCISLLEEHTMSSREKEETRMEKSLKKKNKTLSELLISKTHSELQKQSEKKESYLKQGLALIEKELSALDEKTKVAITNVMFEELKVSIVKAGFVVKEFNFSVYKGASIPEAKANLQDIAVIAEKDAIRFSDSLKNRLKERELVFKEALLRSLK